MRKLIVAAFVSLDGVMQAPGGENEDTSGGFTHGGWTVPLWDDDLAPFMNVFDAPFSLLLGRKTYDIFAAYWPKAPADDPIGPLFTRVTKYVVTSSPQTLTWENSVGLAGDVVAAISELKQQDGPPLLTQGSSRLLHALLETDLVDEIRLMT
ncbi:MAG: dihydrofolate reductase, partial [Caulobacteraceae bacterium]